MGVRLKLKKNEEKSRRYGLRL